MRRGRPARSSAAPAWSGCNWQCQEPAPVAPGGPKPKQRPPRPFPDAPPDRYLVQWKWRANSPRHWHVRGMAAMSSAAIPDSESLCSANSVVSVPKSVAHLTARRRDGCSSRFQSPVGTSEPSSTSSLAVLAAAGYKSGPLRVCLRVQSRAEPGQTQNLTEHCNPVACQSLLSATSKPSTSHQTNTCLRTSRIP
jgi:hypothetical protein